MTPDPDMLAARFGAEIGRDAVRRVPDPAALASPYCRQSHDAGLVLLPADTAELSAICRLASALAVPVVPHGGLTGLVHGTASRPGEVCVSFARMNRVLDIDPMQGTALVEAGVVLEALAAQARAHGLMPGVDIPSKGSCTIGGMIATNAGGVRVLRYGMMRENVLGLEAVLADGSVLDTTNPLLKNNAGYDLRQLFVGSEGTLGLVTRASLRLHPVPGGTALSLLACDGLPGLLALFAGARRRFGGDLLSFEAMWGPYYRLTTSQPGFGALPLAAGHALYGLIEVAGAEDAAAQEALETFLHDGVEDGTLADAVVARSGAQRRAIWRAREDSDAVGSLAADYLSYDIGLRLADIAGYLDAFAARFAAEAGGREFFTFGHLGDGNLHIMFPVSPAEYAGRGRFDDIVYGCLDGFAGSTVSAEHGIGLEKKPYLARSRSAACIAAMRRLKAAFDPAGILNPGKIL